MALDCVLGLLCVGLYLYTANEDPAKERFQTEALPKTATGGSERTHAILFEVPFLLDHPVRQADGGRYRQAFYPHE